MGVPTAVGSAVATATVDRTKSDRPKQPRITPPPPPTVLSTPCPRSLVPPSASPKVEGARAPAVGRCSCLARRGCRVQSRAVVRLKACRRSVHRFWPRELRPGEVGPIAGTPGSNGPAPGQPKEAS